MQLMMHQRHLWKNARSHTLQSGVLDLLCQCASDPSLLVTGRVAAAQGLVPPQQLPTPEMAAKRSEGMVAANSLRTLAFAHRQARDDCRAAADTAALYGVPPDFRS